MEGSSLELKSFQCQIEGHNNSPIIGLCINENCKEKSKFACSECVFEEHSEHKIIRAKEIDNILSKNIELLKEVRKQKDDIMKDYSKLEENMKKEINELKEKATKIICEKINIFFDDLKNQCLFIIIGKNKGEDLIKIKDFINS